MNRVWVWLCRITICLMMFGTTCFASEAEIAEYPVYTPRFTVEREMVSVGKDSESVCISWLSSSQEMQLVTLLPESEQAATQVAFARPEECAYHGMYRYAAQIQGLTPGSTYTYAISKCIGGPWQLCRRFRMPTSDAERGEFLVFGDPQIGGSGHREGDAEKFGKTLEVAFSRWPKAGFGVYMGDLKHAKVSEDLEHQDEAKEEFDLFKEELKKTRVPSVVVCGNHDVQEDSGAFLTEFVVPGQRQCQEADQDYAFEYGPVLFLVLNSNLRSPFGHAEFVRQTVQQHSQCQWKIVLMHHSFFPFSNEKDQKSFAQTKESLVMEFARSEIDLVLSAHNHFYSRTGVLDENGKPGEKGTVYLCCNSSSGSLFAEPWKTALVEQEGVLKQVEQTFTPTYTHCTFVPGELRVETIDAQSGDLVDQVSIQKETDTGSQRTQEEDAEGSLQDRTQSSRIGEKKKSVLLFASDYQHRDGWKDPPDTFSGVLDAVYRAGIKLDNVIFCGDYTSLHGHNNYNADPHDSIEEIKEICLAHDQGLDVNEMIFEQGNHDQLTDDISQSGLHEYDDYLVYVLNTEKDFPWRQGKRHLEKEVIRGAIRLKECLDELAEQGETRPIFLVGHVPLHFSGRSSSLQGTGDNLYSGHLFKVINSEAEKLNLVYLYGHNHSRGWDSYLGGSCVFRKPGDWLLIPQPEEGKTVTSKYTQETLNFTYLNAGYVGYFSSAGGEDTLTCTVCEIEDNCLTFSRYSEDGLHLLTAQGTPNPAKDDRKLIPWSYYGKPSDSPQTVELIARDEGKKRAA